jgi:hypothetical protein
MKSLEQTIKDFANDLPIVTESDALQAIRSFNITKSDAEILVENREYWARLTEIK